MANANEFGPVCRYKDGESHTCTTPEELAEFEKNGWRDTPTVKKSKPTTKKAAKQ